MKCRNRTVLNQIVYSSNGQDFNTKATIVGRAVSFCRSGIVSRLLVTYFISVIFSLSISAQRDSMEMKMDMPMNEQKAKPAHMSMSHIYSLNLPMNRNGSGTGWLPDASKMYGYMYHTRHWMYMLHENLFLRYDDQDFTKKGSRGNHKFDTPDWVMFMGQRPVGRNGLFHFSTMFSLDALTANSGYPLLFQTGESYHGIRNFDRQHPHDLVSELSVSYSLALSHESDIFIYMGYPGEPALGPVAFMHRPSAMDNPDAPLSHHWADATHISFGVATIGIRYGQWKIDGSLFNGREPDDNRYNFDPANFDSWSGRLSFNPSDNWSLQLSHSLLWHPEPTQESVHRTTASAIYSLQTSKGFINATALWGLNKSSNEPGENAFLLEGSWKKNKLNLYARAERVQKSSYDLVLDMNIYGRDVIYPVNALTTGGSYDILPVGRSRIAGGGQLTFYHADERLDALYGKNPMAFEIYLRFYHP